MNFFKAPLTLCLGFALLVVALSPGRLISTDAGTRLLTARYLWTQGTVAIDTEKERIKAGQLIDPMKKGRWVSYFGIGQSLAFIPFDIAGVALAKFARANGDLREKIEWLPIVFIYPAVVAFLLSALIFALLTHFGAAHREAVWGTLISIGTTILLPYLSQTVQEEGAVALLIGAAWLCLLRRKMLAVGLLAGTALLFRLNAVFALIPLAALVVENRRSYLKELFPAFVGFMGMLVIYFAFAYWRFGGFLDTGYSTLFNEGTFTLGPTHPLVSIRPRVAFDLLFGIGKGIFVLSPPLLLVFISYRSLFKTEPLFWGSVIFTFIVSVLFHSRFSTYPDGSECWGNRYQVHLLIYLTVPLSIAFQKVLRSAKLRPLCFLLLFVGVVNQILPCLAPDSIEYIQAGERGKGNEALLAGWETGQLPQRIRNTVFWIQGKEFPSLTIYNRYRPNLWGPVYSKALSGNAAPLLAWILSLISALVFLSISIKFGKYDWKIFLQTDVMKRARERLNRK